jgi:hypothetical protein
MVLESLRPTVELARAYARLAAVRMLFSEHQAAIELAVRAQEIAEPLGALDALSEALNTQGCSVANTGGEWTGYLRRALEVGALRGSGQRGGPGLLESLRQVCRSAAVRRGGAVLHRRRRLLRRA